MNKEFLKYKIFVQEKSKRIRHLEKEKEEHKISKDFHYRRIQEIDKELENL